MQNSFCSEDEVFYESMKVASPGLHKNFVITFNEIERFKELIEGYSVVELEATFFEVAAAERSEMMKILLSSGVNVNCLNDIGYPPMTYAVYKDRHKIVQFLIDHGADIELSLVKDLPDLDAISLATIYRVDHAAVAALDF